jgi:hypothetical protein
MKHRVPIALICGAIALGFFGSRHTGQAQEAQGSSYQAISDKFFNMLQQDEAAEAVDYMVSTNPSGWTKQDVDHLKTQLVSEATRGPYISHTRLMETKVGDRFTYQHFFVAYEREPVSIRIEYYKPGATWECYNLRFDYGVANDIQKSADDHLALGLKQL